MGTVDSAAGLHEGLENGSNTSDIVNSAGQIVATIWSVNPVTSIYGNNVAITLTLFNGDEHQPFKSSDYAGIAGNVTSLVAAGRVFFGGATVGAPAPLGISAIGLAANGLSLILNDNERRVYSNRKFDDNTIASARRLYQQSQWSSPLILDINGDGAVATRSLANGVYFDHDGNQLAERSGWVGAGDAWLARDLNGNGQIDNGGELFGNHTRTGAGTQTFANGFDTPRSLGGNADGFVDAQDATWASLRLWRDDEANAVVDGVVDAVDRKQIQPHPAFMRLAGRKCARRRINTSCSCFILNTYLVRCRR